MVMLFSHRTPICPSNAPFPIERMSMRVNPLRAKIAVGERVLNAWCSIPSPYIAEALAHVGFDSVTVDLQHGAIDYAAAFSMLQGISTSHAVPFARVPWNEPGMLMKLLDSGAYGLICPMINSAADAEAFVKACRYPPLGFRSYGPNRVSQYAGVDYFQGANEQVILLAQIETREAVANVDAILSVEGLDGIYVGPGDLSISMGVAPSMAPKDAGVLASMEMVRARACARGLISAVHTDGAETALTRFAEGFHFCSMPTDMRLLINAAKSHLDRVKLAGN